MRTRYTHILLLILPILLFGFFFYSARKGILLFRDSLRDDAETHVKEVRGASVGALSSVRSILNRMAASGDIRHTLVQYRYGESLEKGQLYLKQVSDRLKHCTRLRLVTLKGVIVVDTVEPTLEGKPLLPAEITRYGSPDLDKTGYAFGTDGTLVVRVPTREVGGLITGSLYAYFNRDFFTAVSRPMGRKELNYAYLYSDDVLFFNLPRNIGDRKKISRIARHLRRTMDPYYQDNVVIFPGRESGFPYVFAYAADRDQIGLPVFARWILLVNGFVILASLLLYILYRRARRQQQELDDFRKEIDTIGESITETAATADQIILETESIYHQSEKVARDVAVAVEQRPSISAPDPVPEPSADIGDVPTVDEILARKAAEPDGGFVEKVHDTELQALIDRAAAEDSESEGVEPMDTTDMDRGAGAEGILGASGLEEYWENIIPLLEKSLGISAVMLLENGDGNAFSPRKLRGIGADEADGFTLRPDEPLFRLFPAVRKVLFVRDSVLSNRTLQEKFPSLPADHFKQLALIPVLQGEALSGILFLASRQDDPEIDIFTLHEVMYLSML